MTHYKNFFSGLFAGIAAPANLGSSPSYPTLTGSDTNRLQQDLQRIGNDFDSVIQQAHVQSKTVRKQPD